jgi:hypothetical protein
LALTVSRQSVDFPAFRYCLSFCAPAPNHVLQLHFSNWKSSEDSDPLFYKTQLGLNRFSGGLQKPLSRMTPFPDLFLLPAHAVTFIPPLLRRRINQTALWDNSLDGYSGALTLGNHIGILYATTLLIGQTPQTCNKADEGHRKFGEKETRSPLCAI